MIRKTLAALALVALGALGIAAPAAATDTPTACPTWQLRSITGPTWNPTPAPGAAVVDATHVHLVKPAAGGTSLETADTGLELAAAADITVHYQLGDGASPTAGAIRVFYYVAAGANTLTDPPTASVAADADAGTLTIHAAAGHVGTLGLVYDASNNAGGYVDFSVLRVGGTAVTFTNGPCTPASPTPKASPSAAPSHGSTHPPSSTSPAPVVATLPVTGSSTPMLVGVALALGGLGMLLVVLGRRRRTEH